MILYNSLTKTKEEFKSIKSGSVGIYTCGPTVYNFAHIGNLRTYLFEDWLKRALLYNNYEVKHVMNVTDVGHLVGDGDLGEDKMETGSTREGKSAWEIADFYFAAFKNDLLSLNILEPNIWCKRQIIFRSKLDLLRCWRKKGLLILLLMVFILTLINFQNTIN